MALIAFGKLALDLGSFPSGVAEPSRPSASPDNAGGHPQRLQMGVISGAVISFITGGFPRMSIDQLGKHHAVRGVAGSGLDADDEFRIGILDDVRLIAVKALFLAFPAKTIRVGAVPIHLRVIVIALGMFLLQAKEVHLGGDVGGIDDVESIADEALGLGLRHYLEELEEHHLEHQHRVPGVPAPIHAKIFQGHLDKGEIHGPGQLVEKIGTPLQQPVINEVPEEGAVGATGLAHGGLQGKIISLILQQVEQFREGFFTLF